MSLPTTQLERLTARVPLEFGDDIDLAKLAAENEGYADLCRRMAGILAHGNAAARIAIAVSVSQIADGVEGCSVLELVD